MEKNCKNNISFARLGTVVFFSLSIVFGSTLIGMIIGKASGSVLNGSFIGIGFGLIIWGVVITLKDWSKV